LQLLEGYAKTLGKFLLTHSKHGPIKPNPLANESVDDVSFPGSARTERIRTGIAAHIGFGHRASYPAADSAKCALNQRLSGLKLRPARRILVIQGRCSREILLPRASKPKKMRKDSVKPVMKSYYEKVNIVGRRHSPDSYRV
jgi:hypothetical protein